MVWVQAQPGGDLVEVELGRLSLWHNSQCLVEGGVIIVAAIVVCRRREAAAEHHIGTRDKALVREDAINVQHRSFHQLALWGVAISDANGQLVTGLALVEAALRAANETFSADGLSFHVKGAVTLAKAVFRASVATLTCN